MLETSLTVYKLVIWYLLSVTWMAWCVYRSCILFFPWRFDPIPGHGLPLRAFVITLIGLLWTSDQPHAETSTWQHTTLTMDRLPCLLAAFEPTIPAFKWLKTYALDRTVTKIGPMYNM